MINIDYTVVSIKDIIIHQIGNKLRDENLLFSKEHTTFSLEKVQYSLLEYFLSHFKSDEQYRFFHDIDLQHNETFIYVSRIFENPNDLIEQSKNLAIHLYNQSTHPKIKRGEFYIVYFKNCILDGETLDAIGLFKSENKDTFLEIEQVANGFAIDSRKGININKLDKGCLIFNTQKENGYLVSVVDNTNRLDAQYWKDDFLNIKPVKNEFHNTNQFLSITKQFLTKQMSEELEISKADQIDLLNRSVDYFKTHEQFNKQDFEEEVLNNDEVIESFREFNESFQKENAIEVADNFEISNQAVKKQARAFKRVLKLDKNFHIYIHGNRDLIEQGVDEKGRKYYKIFYEEEK